jgi:hypothetical protein
MRVYFYACEERDNYQNDLVQLAEGLEELGVEMHSRCDYWQKTPKEGDYLLRRSDLQPEDCDVVVVPYRWFRWIRVGDPLVRSRPMPPAITTPRRKRKYVTVYLDDNDGYSTPSLAPEFSAFDLVLRTKLNRRTWNPPNFQPWAIGLERRVIAATDQALPFSKRRPAIYVNYNASHSFMHTSRRRAMDELHPRLSGVLDTYQPPFADLDEPPDNPQVRLWWEQTNKRHSPQYYDRLKTSQACSAFCGELLPPLPFSPRIFETYGNKAELQKMFWRGLGRFDPRPERIISWDSFRFWETLAAGSVAFHVDLRKSGVALPVMPENWKHYIGVDFRNLERDVRRIRKAPSMLEDIGREGRAWAVSNYSPQAVAHRFLDQIARLSSKAP